MKMQTYKLLLIIIGILLVGTLYLVLADSQISLTTSATLEINNNVLDYNFDWGSTSITLYKNDNVFTNIYSEDKTDGRGWKFGAVDSNVVGTAEYRYVLSSNAELVLLEKQGFNEKENLTYNYPLVYNYHSGKDEWNEYRHIYNFEDVCSKSYSNCEWSFENNILELTFVSDGNIDPEIENVSECRTLETENQEYQLNTPLETDSYCIVITANNITLDLNGYSITGDYSGLDTAISVNSYNDTTIKNGAIYDFDMIGIYLANNQDNNITDITTNNCYIGIYLVNSLNNFIIGNNVSSGDYGIELSYSSNNTINDNVANNGGDIGFYLAYSSDNILQNNEANENIDYDGIGIYFYSSSNNRIIDSEFLDNTDDVILNSNSENNVFLNTTYYGESVYSGCSLIRKWHYLAYANDSAGAVDLASDKIYNQSSYLDKQLITGNDSYAVFDGSNSWVSAARQSWITKNGHYSFSMWVYPNEDSDDWSVLIQNSNSNTDRNCLWIGNDSVNHWVSVGYYDGSWYGASGNLTINSWHHVVGVNNGSTLSIYVDGVQWNEAYVPYCHSTTSYLYIGRQSNNFAYIYNGSIDNFLIFNKSLSASEVSNLYGLGRRDNLYAEDAISAWRFDDTSQSNAVDGIGVNNGTFQGNAGYEAIEYNEGYTEEYELIEYINNAGTKTYYNDYTVHTEKKCYPSYELSHDVSSEQNILDLLTLSNTLQDWNWNFQDNCTLSNREYSVKNITTSNAGTWELNNVNLTVENFDVNSTDEWQVEVINVGIIGGN